MGCVVRAAKKVWNGIKYAAKKVWEGIKYVGQKVCQGIKFVSKQIQNLVKTTIGGVVVMLAVGASLVAGAVISGVLGNFPLGLLLGGTLFMSILIPSALIFGRVNRQQNNNEDENNTNNNEDDTDLINLNSQNPNENKLDLDKDKKEKPLDHLSIFYEDFLSFLNSSGYDINNKKQRMYTFDKNGSSKKKQETEDDNELVNSDEYTEENVITSRVIMEYSEGSSLYYLKFYNTPNKNTKIIFKKIENKLINSLENNYKLSYIIRNKDNIAEEKENIDNIDDKDFKYIEIVIKNLIC